jgi:hypothetical protein
MNWRIDGFITLITFITFPTFREASLYWANEILTWTPALVFTCGAELEIYGVTLRWSK